MSRALAAVGVTPERVSAWVGGPCGCEERRERLNALGAWAGRVLAGRVGRAREYLEVLLGDVGRGGEASGGAAGEDGYEPRPPPQS